MATLLHLETATTNCSVSLAKNGQLLALQEHNAVSYSHATQLHPFIQDVMKAASLSFSDLEGIAVSQGPGSYTGLRIGVAAAKGLCFALDLPLIATPTLQSMARQVKAQEGELIIPVLDARRMEVYSAVFDATHREIRETRAEIVDENTFEAFVSYPKVHIVGSGAEKCKTVLQHTNSSFISSMIPSARDMVPIAFGKYQAGQFEDLAYFEPHYLKDFILGGTTRR